MIYSILKSRKYLKLFITAFVVILLDQITKAVVCETIPLHHSIPVIDGFFDFVHVRNPGGAFGFLADQSLYVRRFFFLFLSCFAVFLILLFYKKTPKANYLITTGLALILGGAVGNLIDRFRFGWVTDFLDFYIGNLHWPAFNVADSAISVGLILFIIHTLFCEKPGS